MKNIYKFLMLILVATSVTLFSCQEDPDYPDLVDLGTRPTFVTDVAVSNVADTGFIMTVTSSISGVAYYVVTTANSVAETPLFTDIIDDDVDGTVASGTINFGAAGSKQVTFTDFGRNTGYDVFAVMTTGNGLAAEVSERVSLTTTDGQDPVIVSFSPSKGTTGVSADVVPAIEFDEPVRFVTGKTVELTGLFSGYSATIAAADVEYDGNMVYLNHAVDFPFTDYIFVNAEAGAFEDLSGNPAPEIYTVNGVQLDWYFRIGADPDQQLENIFENFLGDFVCTDYSNSDSSSVDWGPYGVTVVEDENVEYGVIIENFWAWGIEAKFQFHEDGTITCPEQMLDGIDMGDIYGATYDGIDVWTKSWTPDPYAPAVAGHWDYSDFSFDIVLSFYTAEYGQIYDDIYQSYVVDTSKEELKGQKTQMNRTF